MKYYHYLLTNSQFYLLPLFSACYSQTPILSLAFPKVSNAYLFVSELTIQNPFLECGMKNHDWRLLSDCF